MDINARHKLLREKLDSLGFTQPLPIGSLAIVSALLDDLVLSSKKLKEARKTISKFEQEKSAWDLGVEPYKCDNSKLLAECNALNLEIIRQRDSFQQKIFELNKRYRTLEIENRELNAQCNELNNRVDEFEQKSDDPKHRKHRNDLINRNRRPFISTVRSGEFLPSTLKSMENLENISKTPKCVCQSDKNDIFARLCAEQQANKVKTQLDLIDLYKSQVN